MRMTNKIMRNNSAYNINQNKILQDRLTNQMTTQSKIVRPSDDPVVAIRALRLRSNVTTVTQYNEKNAEDAKQWLTLTADAMTTVDEVLTDLYKQATSSADKYNKSEDLRIFLSQMRQLTEEFYSCANVDYAGRFVFSGYRTDLPVTFTEEDMKEMKEHPVSFNINEDFGFQDISRINYTNYDQVENLNTNIPDTDTTSYEQTVKNHTLYRFRLSYNDVDSIADGGTLSITMPGGVPLKVTAAAGATPDADGMLAATVTDSDGNAVAGAPDVAEFMYEEDAYRAIANGTFSGIAYLPGSGELVFSKDFYEKNFTEVAFNGKDAFHVNYDRSGEKWQNGDINPVHYFECTETRRTSGPDENPPVYRRTAYNTQRDEGRDQDIYYDVGYNQQIQVNTRADEIFTHDVQRDMDDFDHYLKQLEEIEVLQSNLETKQEEAAKEYGEDSPQCKDYERRLEGVKKAWTYIRDNIHTKFENQITKYQQYMDDSRVAMTDNATRGSRLELIKTRLTNQQATYKELQQDNEGIDITEVAVELTSADLTYNAALMATGKIMQTNLMNYI